VSSDQIIGAQFMKEQANRGADGFGTVKLIMEAALKASQELFLVASRFEHCDCSPYLL
jgi:hypothetical protein